jgi:hypothetical protein
MDLRGSKGRTSLVVSYHQQEYYVYVVVIIVIAVFLNLCFIRLRIEVRMEVTVVALELRTFTFRMSRQFDTLFTTGTSTNIVRYKELTNDLRIVSSLEM